MHPHDDQPHHHRHDNGHEHDGSHHPHHHHQHASAEGGHRGHRGHGHGPRGGRRGGGFGFDDEGGMPRGRKLASGDLQLLLLALIAEQPSHGYELIKAIEQRSNGVYVPSPGMMYPALACMEDQGHVDIAPEGKRKRYALSDAGRAHLEANRERVDLMLAKLAAAAEKMRLMRSALAEGDDEQAGGKHWTEEFAQARHALKRALQARAGASDEEQQRIATILARATAEIEAQPGDAQP